MRAKRARMLELTGDEIRTWDRIQPARAARGPEGGGPPWLEMAETYELLDPPQYFAADIKARRRSELEQAQWQMADGAQVVGRAAPARLQAGRGRPAPEKKVELRRWGGLQPRRGEGGV